MPVQTRVPGANGKISLALTQPIRLLVSLVLLESLLMTTAPIMHLRRHTQMLPQMLRYLRLRIGCRQFQRLAQRDEPKRFVLWDHVDHHQDGLVYDEPRRENWHGKRDVFRDRLFRAQFGFDGAAASRPAHRGPRGRQQPRGWQR